MDKNKIIIIAIVILVIALIALGAYISSNNSNEPVKNITIENKTNNTTVIDKDGNVTNNTSVDDNSTINDTNTTNKTYRVYDPQNDSYVTVIGEDYDDEVGRWYTYDTDGVRYYNTRIK